jgi:hypothetical protein
MNVLQIMKIRYGGKIIPEEEKNGTRFLRVIKEKSSVIIKKIVVGAPIRVQDQVISRVSKNVL